MEVTKENYRQIEKQIADLKRQLELGKNLIIHKDVQNEREGLEIETLTELVIRMNKFKEWVNVGPWKSKCPDCERITSLLRFKRTNFVRCKRCIVYRFLKDDVEVDINFERDHKELYGVCVFHYDSDDE